MPDKSSKITPSDFKQLMYEFEDGNGKKNSCLTVDYPMGNKTKQELEDTKLKQLVIEKQLNKYGVGSEFITTSFDTAKADNGYITLKYTIDKSQKLDASNFLSDMQNISQETIDKYLNIEHIQLKIGRDIKVMDIENPDFSEGDKKIYDELVKKLVKVSETGGFKEGDGIIAYASEVIGLLGRSGDLKEELAAQAALKKDGSKTNNVELFEAEVQKLMQELEFKAQENLKKIGDAPVIKIN